MPAVITNEPVAVKIEVRRGSSLTFTATITDAAGNPISLLGHSARLAVRDSELATAQLLLLQVGSGITIQGAGNNQLLVEFTPANTRAVPAGDKVFAFERESPGGVVTPVFAGPYVSLPEIVT